MSGALQRTKRLTEKLYQLIVPWEIWQLSPLYNFPISFTDWYLEHLMWNSSRMNATEPRTLVQVMAWFHQATNYYLSQHWPRFMSPYQVLRPQWVKNKHTEADTKWPTFCRWHFSKSFYWRQFDGILLKGPYPPCLRMAGRALLAGNPRIVLESDYTEVCS